MAHLGMRNAKGALSERFVSLVDKNGPVPSHRPDLGPCWVFLGTPSKSGYAYVSDNGRSVRLHGWAYETFVGPIPAGLELDHVCRVKVCANPVHLEPVTHAENVRRANLALGKASAARSACVNGHPYTDATSYTQAGGKRICRTCRNAAVSRHKNRRRNEAA